jgi:hypothetical protein
LRITLSNQNRRRAIKDLSNSSIGNYRVVKVLGRGGMATVYRARQETMGRDVAIKIVSTDDQEIGGMPLKRFGREVRLIARLQHPRILPVYDYGRTSEFTYLVMRLVETGTLADRLKDGPLDPGEAARILDELASALDYAHARGVIHRDLKPSNVFLDEQGNIYLADFGIAKLLDRVDTQLTASGFVLGTPAYMSPEQATDGPIDRRTDVYALGLILFEMLTGRQVFAGDSAISIILKHVNELPPLPSSLATHLTPQVDAVVSKALAKSPDDRFQTAGALAAVFQTAIQAQPPAATDVFEDATAEPVVARESVPTAARPNWALLLGGGLAGLLIVVLAGAVALNALLKGQEGGAPTATPPIVAAIGDAVTPTPTFTRPSETAAPTATPSPEPEGAVAAIETPAGLSTTPEPTLLPSPTPSPAPTPLPPTSTPEPTTQRVGRVRFLTGGSRLDTVNVQLAEVEAPPAGRHYEGWLLDDSGDALNLGRLTPDTNGNVDFTYTDPAGRNLAAVYSGFRASLEPDFGDSPEMSREIVLEGSVSAAVFVLVREMVLRAPETPLHSLLDGLETEVALGRDHLGFSRAGLAAGNLGGGQNHAEHAVNILVGNADPRFGDKNGDGQVQNPGDGTGVLGYLATLREKTVAAGEVDPTSTELALHVGFLEAVTQNSLLRTDGIVRLLERAFVQDSTEGALTLVDQAIALYDELLNGFDLNGNGAVEPIQGEGGTALVVEHTGYLGNIEVYRVQGP